MIKKSLLLLCCFCYTSIVLSGCGDNDVKNNSFSSNISSHAEQPTNSYGSYGTDVTPSSASLSDTALISSESVTATADIDTNSTSASSEAVSVAPSNLRDSSIVCLVPSAPGVVIYSNSVASIDASNQSEGYVCVRYDGTCPKVKLQITKKDSTTYTYNLYAGHGYDTFPLSDGSGTYFVVVYENVYDNQYAVALSQTLDVTITNTFGPNLYPNQYVSFSEKNETVQIAADLVANCQDDLSAVTTIYNYVSANIQYDYQKAETVQSGYLCDIDQTLKSGTGICLDYASVMCSMLRSQRIPTRLEVGYAGSEYHAWISTYINEIGWVNGIIQFDGQNWQIMDPTFASTSKDPEQLKSFLSNSDNYHTKYIY